MTEGRDNKGRFQKGAVQNPKGRRSKADELGLPALLDECWTVEDRKACIVALAHRAVHGVGKEANEAAALLLAYTYGKPTERVEQIGQQQITVVYADTNTPQAP